jgi:hypothetical protein
LLIVYSELAQDVQAPVVALNVAHLSLTLSQVLSAVFKKVLPVQVQTPSLSLSLKPVEHLVQFLKLSKVSHPVGLG